MTDEDAVADTEGDSADVWTTESESTGSNQTTTSMPETVVNEDAQLDIDASSGTLAYPSFWTGFWTGMQTTEE